MEGCRSVVAVVEVECHSVAVVEVVVHRSHRHFDLAAMELVAVAATELGTIAAVAKVLHHHCRRRDQKPTEPLRQMDQMVGRHCSRHHILLHRLGLGVAATEQGPQ